MADFPWAVVATIAAAACLPLLAYLWRTERRSVEDAIRRSIEDGPEADGRG